MNLRGLFFRAFIIAVIVISTIGSIAYFTHNKVAPRFSDDKLREFALSKGLRATPSDYNELKKLVDTPQNPLTKQKIELGKKLFFDETLSHTQKTSCATCHSFNPDIKNSHGVLENVLEGKKESTNCVACHLNDQSGVDRLTFSVGDGGVVHPHLLNVQTILNSGFYKYYTWSGEIKSIADEAKNSFLAKHKLATSKDELELKLKNYEPLFSRANLEPNIQDASLAIEAYVKTLVTRGSYDRFLEGDNSAINDAAKRGLEDFIYFGCKGCHLGVTLGAQSIQRFPLRDFAGIYELRLNEDLLEQFKNMDSKFPFKNSGDFLGKDSNYYFRVPSLRNVTKTSPYFHNGGIIKIREAVDIMARHQIGRHMKDEQIDDIVEFLRTLEGDIVEYNYE